MRVPVLMIAVFLTSSITSMTAKAVDDGACRDPDLVSFTMKTPYSPEVADIVFSVWIPHFIVPCPAIGWAIGQSQLPMVITDARAQNIALLHSAAIILLYLPAVFTIVGIPFLFIELFYIAPVSIINALDRDVRCAKQGGAPLTPTPLARPTAPTTTTPAPTTKPPGDRPRLDPTPPPGRDEPLPPPPPKYRGTDPEGPREMAW
ncbi:MAG: hypothetical protein Q8O67_24955 [Deltaproteobacteria bacterium]|nr:hypothetical protein [Deltaproteobacteria bacterium]